MAIDMFLKIDGIDGESTDVKHNNEIAILSYAWGEAQTAPAGGAGGGAGKIAMQDFHFSMLVRTYASIFQFRYEPEGFSIWVTSMCGLTGLKRGV